MISAICASQLIQSGMSSFDVSNILGHVDVQTTQRYAHLEKLDVGRKARDIMGQMRV
jgi:site-specific recombinase XerD